MTKKFTSMDTATKQSASVITSAQLLKHWQGQRNLTRRVIETFPEKEFFDYSIGGMRPFARVVMELLGIAVPALREIEMVRPRNFPPLLVFLAGVPLQGVIPDLRDNSSIA